MGNLCETHCTNPKFHCTVKIGDKQHIYEIKMEHKVGDLKKMIEEKQGHKVAEQSLTQDGVDLDDLQDMNELKLEIHD